MVRQHISDDSTYFLIDAIYFSIQYMLKLEGLCITINNFIRLKKIQNFNCGFLVCHTKWYFYLFARKTVEKSKKTTLILKTSGCFFRWLLAMCQVKWKDEIHCASESTV